MTIAYIILCSDGDTFNFTLNTICLQKITYKYGIDAKYKFRRVFWKFSLFKMMKLKPGDDNWYLYSI